MTASAKEPRYRVNRLLFLEGTEKQLEKHLGFCVSGTRTMPDGFVYGERWRSGFIEIEPEPHLMVEGDLYS